jgi:hypothetical protein
MEDLQPIHGKQLAHSLKKHRGVYPCFPNRNSLKRSRHYLRFQRLSVTFVLPSSVSETRTLKSEGSGTQKAGLLA